MAMSCVCRWGAWTACFRRGGATLRWAALSTKWERAAAPCSRDGQYASCHILQAKELAEFLRAEALFASRIRFDCIQGTLFVASGQPAFLVRHNTGAFVFIGMHGHCGAIGCRHLGVERTDRRASTREFFGPQHRNLAEAVEGILPTSEVIGGSLVVRDRRFTRCTPRSGAASCHEQSPPFRTQRDYNSPGTASRRGRDDTGKGSRWRRAGDPLRPRQRPARDNVTRTSRLR